MKKKFFQIYHQYVWFIEFGKSLLLSPKFYALKLCNITKQQNLHLNIITLSVFQNFTILAHIRRKVTTHFVRIWLKKHVRLTLTWLKAGTYFLTGRWASWLHQSSSFVKDITKASLYFIRSQRVEKMERTDF